MNSVAFYALRPKGRYVYPPKVELYRTKKKRLISGLERQFER
jgi:hypothetical protein